VPRKAELVETSHCKLAWLLAVFACVEAREAKSSMQIEESVHEDVGTFYVAMQALFVA